MAILRQREVWRRPKAPAATSPSVELTAAERDNIRRGMRELRCRFGPLSVLAAALRVSARSVQRAMGPRGKPSAAMAVRAARLAGVPFESLLDGTWPPEGPCPACGRTGYMRRRALKGASPL